MSIQPFADEEKAFTGNSPVIYKVPEDKINPKVDTNKTTTMADAKPFVWMSVANGNVESQYGRPLLKKTWITRFTCEARDLQDVPRLFIFNIVPISNQGSFLWPQSMNIQNIQSELQYFDFNIQTPLYIERENPGDYLFWRISPAVNGVLQYFDVIIWGYEIDY